MVVNMTETKPTVIDRQTVLEHLLRFAGVEQHVGLIKLVDVTDAELFQFKSQIITRVQIGDIFLSMLINACLAHDERKPRKRKRASNYDKSQIYSPREIVEFMVEITGSRSLNQMGGSMGISRQSLNGFASRKGSNTMTKMLSFMIEETKARSLTHINCQLNTHPPH